MPFKPEILTNDSEYFVNKNLSIFQIIANLNYFDTNPPYQRGNVWKTPFKQELLWSIFHGIPINTLHFVIKSENEPHLRYVLDGKQRLETIRSFINNHFKVKMEWGDKTYEIAWSDITNPHHPCHHLMTKMQEFQINVVIWNEMTMDEQKDVFVRINYSTSLNNDEKIYCEHYLVQKLLKYVYSGIKNVLTRCVNKSVAEDYRFSAVRMIHSIFLLCYGLDFQEQFNWRELKSEKVRKSCYKIEELLTKNKIDASTNADTIKGIKEIKTAIEQFELAVKWVDLMLSYKNNLTKWKKLESSLFIDYVSFFIKKQQEGVLTNSYVQQNLGKIRNFIDKWYHYKNENKDRLKRRTTQLSNVRDRFQSIEKVFNDMDFDFGVKNRCATKEQKFLASMESNGFCPINNIILTDDNVRFDHVDPTAASSESKIVAVSDIANNKKGGLTKASVESVNKYMENNQTEEKETNAGIV